MVNTQISPIYCSDILPHITLYWITSNPVCTNRYHNLLSEIRYLLCLFVMPFLVKIVKISDKLTLYWKMSKKQSLRPEMALTLFKPGNNTDTFTSRTFTALFQHYNNIDEHCITIYITFPPPPPPFQTKVQN